MLIVVMALCIIVIKVSTVLSNLRKKIYTQYILQFIM